jgi:hypothetical protein
MRRAPSAAAGLGFVVLTLAAGLVLGDAPNLSDDAVVVSDFFDAEHVRVVTAVYLQGLAIVGLLVFVTAFNPLARGAGLLVAVSLALSTIVLGALAYRGTDDASTAQSIYDVAALATNFGAFPAAVLVAAASRPLIGLPLAVLLLVDAATFAGEGFFSPQGLLSRIAFVAFLAWVAATSVRLARRQNP